MPLTRTIALDLPGEERGDLSLRATGKDTERITGLLDFLRRLAASHVVDRPVHIVEVTVSNIWLGHGVVTERRDARINDWTGKR